MQLIGPSLSGDFEINFLNFSACIFRIGSCCTTIIVSSFRSCAFFFSTSAGADLECKSVFIESMDTVKSDKKNLLFKMWHQSFSKITTDFSFLVFTSRIASFFSCFFFQIFKACFKWQHGLNLIVKLPVCERQLHQLKGQMMIVFTSADRIYVNNRSFPCKFE